MAHYHLEYVSDQTLTADWFARVEEMLNLITCAGVSWEMVEGDETNAFRFNDGPGFNTGELGRIVGSS